jgi:YcaO-like protein with predicted kinase domain
LSHETLSPGVAAGTTPLRFRGREHTAAKRFWEGTQRVIAPAETIERVRPHFKRLGLTRLADITGLDRIGIPIVLSIRPNSFFLSVDAGKGFTAEAAKASAAMECVERFHGENADLTEIHASYDAVVERHVAMPFELLPVARAAHVSRAQPMSWTLGWDLLGQREVAVPTMMVRLEKRGRVAQPVPFQTGSNGLSAGNNLLEALSGGLLECVERDAVSCQRTAWERSGVPIPRVRLETIEHPAVNDLLDRFERAGVSVVLFDCTVDTGIPVYMAYVFDRVLRHIGIYRGYGAHLDPGIAMVRALTEAAQGRLIFVAGSRDDFFRHEYLRLKQGDDAEAIRFYEGLPATVDARECRSVAAASFEDDVRLILERLRDVGLEQVIVFDLTLPGFQVASIRVVVPGLEGYLFDYYAPGPRARRFIEHRKAEAGKV